RHGTRGRHLVDLLEGAEAALPARAGAAQQHHRGLLHERTVQRGEGVEMAGPGHLNALSALYGALMEESPVVLLSGASPRGQRGLGAFQEIDQVAAARPVT